MTPLNAGLRGCRKRSWLSERPLDLQHPANDPAPTADPGLVRGRGRDEQRRRPVRQPRQGRPDSCRSRRRAAQRQRRFHARRCGRVYPPERIIDPVAELSRQQKEATRSASTSRAMKGNWPTKPSSPKPPPMSSPNPRDPRRAEESAGECGGDHQGPGRVRWHQCPPIPQTPSPDSGSRSWPPRWGHTQAAGRSAS